MKKLIKSKKILKMVIVLIGIIYFICIFINQQKTLNSYKSEQQYISEQIQQQQEYKDKLANTKENIDSPEYIEEIARDKLDMYLPNERVYVDVNK